MHFNLVHVVPGKMAHGLNGYKEVIDTIQWGLRELGHRADYSLNTISPTATNIIFGFQVLTPELLESLPPETIIFHAEQLRGFEVSQLKPQALIAARRFEIWDYSRANDDVWRRVGAGRLRHVPIGYAPVLQRIPKATDQDIDVLIYGSPGEDRLSAFHYLARSGLTTVFVAGLYGSARDGLIARSKLIANINLFTNSKIFEVVRVSYLLANRKAVVADIDSETFIDEDIRAGIAVSTSGDLVDRCLHLASHDEERAALEERGFAAIEKRDIRAILTQALKA